MISKLEEEEVRHSQMRGTETVTNFSKDDPEGWQFCNDLLRDLLKFAPVDVTGTSELHERAKFLKSEQGWSLDQECE